MTEVKKAGGENDITCEPSNLLFNRIKNIGCDRDINILFDYLSI